MAVELFLSAVAGAAAAAAASRAASGRSRTPRLGASPRIRAEVSSLEARKRILERSIARLGHGVEGVTDAQRDALLARYQRELGEIGARLGALEEASSHPDLGALGDGLVTVMDRRLSEIDARFDDLSARIASAQGARAAGASAQGRGGGERAAAGDSPRQATRAGRPGAAPRSMELTTLTVVPAAAAAGAAPQPFAPLAPQGVAPQGVAPPPAPPAVAPEPAPPADARPEPAPPAVEAGEPVVDVPPVPVPPVPAPAGEEEIDDAGDDSDEEDLAKIKRDILKTLNRLDQAEVE